MRFDFYRLDTLDTPCQTQTVLKMASNTYVPSEDEKEQFMSRAIELSEEGAAKRIGEPFGSVIVKDGKIVGQCFQFFFIHIHLIICKVYPLVLLGL